MFHGKPDFEPKKTTSSLEKLVPSIRMHVKLPHQSVNRFAKWMEGELEELCAQFPNFETPDSNTYFMFFERE